MTKSLPILYRNGSVYSPADPFATAMLVDGDTVAWVGSEHAARNLTGEGVRTVDLNGALITPGFGASLGRVRVSSCTLDRDRETSDWGSLRQASTSNTFVPARDCSSC